MKKAATSAATRNRPRGLSHSCFLSFLLPSIYTLKSISTDTLLRPTLHREGKKQKKPARKTHPLQSFTSTLRLSSPARPKSYRRRDLNPHNRNDYGILSPACLPIPPLRLPFERKTGLEPATPTLARLCSTN